MASTAEHVFWACLWLLAYTYFLYPGLLFAAYVFSQVRRDLRFLLGQNERRRAPLGRAGLPRVTLIVPAHNEEVRLPAKIANLRELDYPREALEVVIVSDGCTDRTNEILRGLREPGLPGLQVLLLSVRQGKAAALNYGVMRARHEILVFSDASTLFARDALQKLVRHFSDPDVGVVCGSLRFEGGSEFEQTEGVYWKYESALRLMEARLGATLTASGAIYAVRRRSYRPIGADVLIDDFVIPLNARRLGYRVVFDPEAMATEFAADSVRDEFTRRVRLAVGSFRALPLLASARLDAFTLLAFFSHKLLRWVLPFVMMGLLLSSAVLWPRPLYRYALLAQLAFYLWAGVGFLWRRRLQQVRYALIGYFLFAMNAAFLVGFMRLLTGQGVKWKRVS